MSGPRDAPGLADEAGLASARGDASDYGSAWESDGPPVRKSAMTKTAAELATRGVHELKSSPVANFAVFIFLPWVVFTVVMAPFALGYRHCATLAWIVFAAAALLSASFYFFGKSNEATPAKAKLFVHHFWQHLSYLCVVATLLGMGLGFYDFFKHVTVYHTYEASRFYQNVLPSQAPGEFMDAGMFTFSQETSVDPTRSVGFTAVTHRYCAAPLWNKAAVKSPVKGALPAANFWAVGLDCCHARGHFECGPVWDDAAHSGLRVLDASPLQGEETSNYMVAVRQAAAAYGLAAPENAILLKWTKSPQELPQAYWEEGVHFYKKAVGIYIAVVLAIALCGTLYWESRRVSGTVR